MGMRFVTSGAMDARQGKMDFAVMRKEESMGKEEIIERLEEIAKHAVHVLREKPFFMSLDDGIAIHEAIDVLKSAQPEQWWIPVGERLPEVHESGDLIVGIYMQSDPVLVYGVCEYEDNAQFNVVTYCDDLNGNTYWSTELDAITVNGVIAWMPLPSPYTEETT